MMARYLSAKFNVTSLFTLRGICHHFRCLVRGEVAEGGDKEPPNNKNRAMYSDDPAFPRINATPIAEPKPVYPVASPSMAHLTL